MSQSLSKGFKNIVDKICRLPVVGILVRAGLEGQKDLAKDMAASIAYFTFLSLFPLILGIVAISGFFLKSAEAQVRVNEFIVELLPVSADLVTRNIDSLVRLRGAAGLTSIIVLMWSGSKMVGALSRGINSALGLKRPYAFYLSKLRNFGLTLIVTLLIFIAIAVTPMVEILDELELGFIGDPWNSYIGLIAGHAGGFAITSVLLGMIYVLIPFERPYWKDLLPGILVAALFIELGKELFVLYVERVSRYDTVYGSVSSIIVLLIWFYFSARVLLYGTEVICVYRLQREQESTEEENERESEVVE
jgi:membrane protein